MRYFRGNRGFDRLFRLMLKKYQGLGRIGGRVTLKDLTRQEREALSLFLGRDYTQRRSATVALEDVTAALNKTKFAGIGLKELLDGYVGRDVRTRAEEQERRCRRKAAFFRDLAGMHDSDYGRLWLEHVQRAGPGTRGIHQAYEKHPKVLFGQLTNVLAALRRLALQRDRQCAVYERLPVFAGRAVNDPHGFDLDTDQGRFLVSALQLIRSGEDPEYTIRSRLSAEETSELLGHFGIVRDDVLNFTTCAGLVAVGKSGDPVPWWQAAWDGSAVLNVPLRELVGVDVIVPATCREDSAFRVVFVVENSGVFSEVLDAFSSGRLPPLVCTHGQFKLACLVLLDKLAAAGTTIYYSGDFDPEGLQMASRLLQRYPGRAVLWRYTVADYERCLSGVILSESRLKRFETVDQPVLAPVLDRMRALRKAGYQEHLVEALVADIRERIRLRSG